MARWMVPSANIRSRGEKNEKQVLMCRNKNLVPSMLKQGRDFLPDLTLILTLCTYDFQSRNVLVPTVNSILMK